MDAAAARLAPDGLIACTDADSTVAPDWVAAQLAAAAAGARAIGGRIEIAPAEMAQLPPGVARDRLRRQRRRHRLVLADPGPPGSTSEHWQFSGASLAVTADVYRRVGGMGPDPALEDEAFERALIAHGVPIHRPLAVRVTTSGRLVGRAERGLAHDLARPPRMPGCRIQGRVAQQAYDRTSDTRREADPVPQRGLRQGEGTGDGAGGPYRLRPARHLQEAAQGAPEGDQGARPPAGTADQEAGWQGRGGPAPRGRPGRGAGRADGHPEGSRLGPGADACGCAG